MRKVILMFALGIAATACYAQSRQYPYPVKKEDNKYVNFNTSWGQWEPYDCYKGIYIRVKLETFGKPGTPNDDRGTGFWAWRFEFKNMYKKRVAFSWAHGGSANELQERMKKYGGTTSRKTLEPGESYSNLMKNYDFNWDTKKMNIHIDGVCFSFKNNSFGNIVDDCSSNPDKGKENYATCDNGIPKVVPHSVQNKNSQESGSVGTNHSLSKNEESDESNVVGRLQGEQQEQRQKEEQRQQQEQQRLSNQYNSYLQTGDAAYNSGDYSTAMSNYSSAYQYAQTDAERQTADQKHKQASEAKRNDDRNKRLANQKKADQRENEAFVGMAAGVGTLMSLAKDSYSDRLISLKGRVGALWERMPLITNQTNPYAMHESFSDDTSYPGFLFGLNFELFNETPVNLKLGADGILGTSALMEGISGLYTEYRIKSGLQFWYKTDTRFKLFADAEYIGRQGDYTIDYDAMNGGTTATDNVREGKYKYKVLRFGGGPMWHRKDYDGEETWIKPGIYFENISFAKNAPKPTMSFSLSTNIASMLIIEFSYSKNYPVAGTINYPQAFFPKNQNYFSVRVIRQGRIF